MALKGTISKWKSESYVSGVITSIVSLLAIAGYQVKPELLTDLTGTIVALVTGVTGVISLRGRFTATKTLK